MRAKRILHPYTILVSLFYILNFPQTKAQTLVNELWEIELNYPDTIEWSASKLYSNNLYATGNTWHNATQKTNIVTTKTNSSGSVIWQTEYNGTLSGFDYGAAITLDGSGNVFVAGATHNTDSYTFDVVVIKYNSSGVQQWATTYNGTGSNNDIPSSILILGTDIYVCAASIGSSSAYDYVLLKLNSSGTTQWNARYDYTSLYDIPGHLASNGTYVFVSGASQSSTTNWDYTSLKYNTSGTLIQSQRSAASGYGFDRPTGMVTDASDNFYISGYSFNGDDYDMRTIKLDDDLSPLWTVSEDDGAEDGSNAICIDGSNNVYIAGFAESSFGNKLMKIVKYNSSGTLQWEEILQNRDNYTDAEATGITYNSTSERVIVCGFYEYTTGKKEITTFAMETSDGDLAWKKEYPNLNSSIDVPTKIHESGNYVWVQGRRTEDDTTRYVTIKYEMYDRENEFYEDSLGNNIYPLNYAIISFHPDSVTTEFVNNIQKEFSSLNEVINSETYNSVLPFLKGSNQQFVPKAIKIYKRMTEGDTISISRLGDSVFVPKLWADFVVSIDTTVNINQLIDSLKTKKYIYRGVFKDYVAVQFGIPNDPLYDEDQESLHNTVLTPTAHINIEPAWDMYDFGGRPDIRIGVYDGGINWGHEDFGDGTYGGIGGSKVIGGNNYFDGVDIFSVAHNDETGHGTACASLTGALRNNSLGIAGIAGGNVDDDDNPGTSLYAMKIFGTSDLEDDESATTSEISEAVAEGAISPPYGYGLNISNHSYGVLLDFDHVEWDENDYDGIYLQYGFKQMFLNQSICAVASGNEAPWLGIELETPVYPASFPDYWVIKTGANDDDGDRADFSVFNNLLDLIAPGTNDLYMACAPLADDVYTDLLLGGPLSGTSFAGPHVAGVAGLMLSYINGSPGTWNNLAPADVEELMQRYITDVAPTNYDIFSGHGRLNAGAIFDVIELPNYQVRHYEPVVSTVSADKISEDEVFFLSEPYGDLSAGNYSCDQYELTITVSHDIGDADLLNWWDLDASNNVWGYTDYAINPLPEIVIESCSETSATLRGYFYHFKYEAVYPFDEVELWYPCDNAGTTKLAYTLHLYDPTPASAIEDINSEDRLSIYPNPGSNYFEIFDSALTENNFNKLQITDITGKVIVEDQITFSNKKYISNSGLAELPPGIYLINLQSEENRVSLKWIKL